MTTPTLLALRAEAEALAERMYIDDGPEDWPEDVTHIQSVLDAEGATYSRRLIEHGYRLYSESYMAGWLSLPTDSVLVRDVSVFIEAVRRRHPGRF